LKSLSSRTLRLEFLRREGWKINDLSPLSWQFFVKFYDLLGCFKRLRVFETDFSFKKTQISRFRYHEMFLFSDSCLFAKDVLLQKIDCVFVLAIRGLLHMTKNFVMWSDFCALITFYEIFPFEKFSLRKSWCCRKHVFVFEIVSLRNLNKVDQIIFFP
jgi:hypothetical protein